MNAQFNSVAGQKLLAITGKFVATGTGKVLILKLSAILTHLLASAAFRSAILTSIKKVGIGILLKTAIGKVVIAFLVSIGIAKAGSISIGWVVLPLVGYIVWHDYKNFPKKLADKVSDGTISSIKEYFGSITEDVVSNLVKLFMRQMVDHIFGKVNKKIDDFTQIKFHDAEVS